jgi:hypothetical protein
MTNSNATPKFIGNLLQWPVNRSVRTFRVFVVEPKGYQPDVHGGIFNAAVTALTGAQPELVDPFADNMAIAEAEPFDLVTFPEAFLPQDDLLAAFAALPSFCSFGCIHVGLRPSADSPQHLFTVQQIERLIDAILAVQEVHSLDLDNFSRWLKHQGSDERFNIGCLFTIDAHAKLRVCLHPKLVRSKFEMSPLSEQHMAEGNLLSLVTLLPTDKRLKSVTVQPLLCSDALHLATDRPGSWPLDGVNEHPECFDGPVPDHVDIVSLAVCTPQVLSASKTLHYRVWHQDFLNAFHRAATELHRHYSATFICSNFQELSDESPGGLSGGFIPVPSPKTAFPSYVVVSSWGNGGTPPNRWSTPDNDISAKGWSSLGHIASLSPAGGSESETASMLGFTVLKFPRDAASWSTRPGFAKFQLRRTINSSGVLTFEKVDSQ